MKEIEGNLWDFYYHTNHVVRKRTWIVVPTNGDVNVFGNAVMGRGVAAQVKRHIPSFPHRFGKILKERGNSLHLFHDVRIITFPVKHSWREEANLPLLTISARQLAASPLPEDSLVYLPRVGCGNGRRDWSEVKPILEQYLTTDRFIVVHLSAGETAGAEVGSA